jgi:translation elongation factor EF-G
MARAPISLDIAPKTPADRHKLARTLQVLVAEHDQLEVRPGAEPDCTVIGATSEAHLGQIIDRLKREFEVEAIVGRPTVAYLETVTQSAEGSAKHVRMAHGHGEYAHVSLRLRPAEAGSGNTFEDTTIGGAIPKRFMASMEGSIKESMANGTASCAGIRSSTSESKSTTARTTILTRQMQRSERLLRWLSKRRRRRPSHWYWCQSCRSP